MKRHALITSLALGLAAFMWSCQDQGSVPLSPREPDQVLMAKGGKPDKPGKPGPGGTEEATFQVTFTGDVTGGPHSWTQNLSSGAKQSAQDMERVLRYT